MPYGLERFWQSAFCWFFRPFLATHEHLWTLETATSTGTVTSQLPPLSVEWPWHSTSYLTRVRFQCKCKRGWTWTSMKGRVSFWLRIRRQGDQIFCEVLFKLFRQKCNFCNPLESVNESEFLPPLWYPDEIENVIMFLSSQVITAYYGRRKTEGQPPSIFVFTTTRPTTTVHWFTMIPLVVKLVTTDYVPLPNLTLPNCPFDCRPIIFD